MDAMVARRLREARRWLILQQYLDYAVLSLFAGLTVFAISRIAAASLPGAEVPWWAAVTISLIIAAFGAIHRWRSLRSVALELDARAKTKDRFLTAFVLPANRTGGLLDAVRRETSLFASTLDPRRHLVLKFPAKRAVLLLLPAIALGIWEGFRAWQTMGLAPELAAARRIVEQAQHAAELEAERDESLKQAAAQLQTAEEQLNVSKEPLREALRTLSDLEQRLASQSGLEPAEANALAEALSRDHAELASHLRAGKNGEASRLLEKLDPSELAAALEQAARHLEARRLRELASQSAAASKLQLGNMLGSSPGKGNDGRHRLAATLRDIRSGSEPAVRDPSRQIKALEASPGNEESSAYAADNAPPSGLPGTEKDLGRGEDIARQGEPLGEAARSEDFLDGEIGEGSSLIELFRTAGNDDPRVRRNYRNAYQAAVPAALDAVSQEQIPAGSRLLVRRYFEAIRPRE